MHPVFLKLGPVTFYSYGLLIALGFLAASWAASNRARRIGLDPAQVQNVALTALLFGVLGARAAYIGLNGPIYRGDWVEMIRLDHGGLVFYGGFVGGAAAVLWMIRRKNLPFWITVDLLVPPLVLAHAFGRVGCFLNGCCYGKPFGTGRHPTQLYEAAFLLVLFLFLKRIEFRGASRPGKILLMYGVAYGSWRFAVEFLRGDNPPVWAGLTIFQLASVALVLVSAVALSLRGRSPKQSRDRHGPVGASR